MSRRHGILPSAPRDTNTLACPQGSCPPGSVPPVPADFTATGGGHSNTGSEPSFPSPLFTLRFAALSCSDGGPPPPCDATPCACTACPPSPAGLLTGRVQRTAATEFAWTSSLSVSSEASRCIETGPCSPHSPPAA